MTEPVSRNIKVIRYASDTVHASVVFTDLYARYSTDNQAYTSTEDQLRRLRRGVDRREIKSLLFPKAVIEILHEYKDDAISGFGTVGRDGLNAALAEIREGKAQILLVDDFKRFVRDMGSTLFLYDFLQDYNAELISISDGFSSAEPGARLKFMNKAYASEEFLEGVSQDTKRGLNERREEGYSDGHLWFGVGSKPSKKIQIKGREKDSHYEYCVIQHLADIVLKIFEMARDGSSDFAIAETLTAKEIPPPRCWDKNGNLVDPKKKIPWLDKTVWHILNNKAYIGIIERGRTKVVRRNDGGKKTLKVPREKWLVIERPEVRIVPQDLWDAVRARVQKYHAEKVRAGVSENKPFKYDGTTNKILTGVVKCHRCSTGLVQTSGKSGGRYGCPAHRKSSGLCDNKKTILARWLDGTVIDWLLEQVRSDEVFSLLASKYNKLLQQRLSGDSLELNQKESELAQVQRSIDNIIRRIEDGTDSPALTARLHELEPQKKKLVEQVNYLRGLNKSQVLMTPLAIKQRFDEIPKLLKEKTPNEVNRVLKSLFRGSDEMVVVPRNNDEREEFWVVGKLNVGRLMNVASTLSGEHANSEVLAAVIPFELRVRDKD